MSKFRKKRGKAAKEVKKVKTEPFYIEIEPYIVFEWVHGGEIYVSESGLCVLNGRILPAGEYELKDGNTITVNDFGILVVPKNA